MSALRRIKKVKEGYEVTVSCTNKPTLTAFYRTYEQCEKFADDYFFDYLGVQLKSVHHPEGDGVEPDGVNPESLETVEIEIPMNKRLKELSRQAGFKNWGYDEELERFAELVRADEREACAKLCEEGLPMGMGQTIGPMMCAAAIRARGNHEQD
jgi:hypothetical protein